MLTLLLTVPGCVSTPTSESVDPPLQPARIEDFHGSYHNVATVDAFRSPDDEFLTRRNLWYDLTLKKFSDEDTGRTCADTVLILPSDEDHLLLRALIDGRTVGEKTIRVKAEKDGIAWLIVDAGEVVQGVLPVLKVLAEAHRWIGLTKAGDLVAIYRDYALESAYITFLPTSSEFVHSYPSRATASAIAGEVRSGEPTEPRRAAYPEFHALQEFDLGPNPSPVFFKDETAWIGRGSRLLRIADVNKGDIRELPPSSGRHGILFGIGDKNLWARKAGWGGGVCRISQETGEVLAKYRGSCVAAVFGHESVWALLQDDRLVRLNPESLESQAKIKLHRGVAQNVDLATRETRQNLVITPAHLFAVNMNNGKVYKIDPLRNTLVDIIETGNSDCTSVAADANAVWLVSRLTGQVTRIDLDSSNVRREFDLNLGIDDLAIGDGKMWLVHSTEHGTLPRHRYLTMIDLEDNDVTRARVDWGANLWGIASFDYHNGRLWLTSSDGLLRAYSPMPFP